ncbi:hypothetical protein AMTRI_Chr10g1170 [Amborella trichopoda]|uniref:uncharacterized protein LOC110007318 n=1 Tax=Amborella trichopoda TaxID=13333 RepID=UPI0009BF20FC|nr:uncharacterized protein LOC110007318 [Amborella trichopoda]|eukprot:XP_020523247.1 uncharacterized protein LOC110007318 [Amborella trichopoda]
MNRQEMEKRYLIIPPKPYFNHSCESSETLLSLSLSLAPLRNPALSLCYHNTRSLSSDQSFTMPGKKHEAEHEEKIECDANLAAVEKLAAPLNTIVTALDNFRKPVSNPHIKEVYYTLLKFEGLDRRVCLLAYDDIIANVNASAAFLLLPKEDQALWIEMKYTKQGSSSF